MHQQILRGAKIGNCVLQEDDVRIEIKCDFTDTIQEEMDWAEPSQSQKLATFDDQIGQGSFKISSDQKALGSGTTEIAVPFESMSGFRVVRCKEKGQDSTRLELRFHVCTIDTAAVISCQEYKRTVKKGVGQMRITVGKEAAKAPAAPLFDASGAENATIHELSKIQTESAKKQRGRPRKTIIDAASAEVSVEMDPEERERLDKIIGHSIGTRDGDQFVDSESLQ